MFFEEAKPSISGGFGGSLYSMVETINLIKNNCSDFKFIIITYYEIPAIYNLININEVEYRFLIPFNKFIKSTESKHFIKKSKFSWLPFFLKTDISMYLMFKRIRHYFKIIDELNPSIIWGNNRTSGNFACLISAAIKKIPYLQHQRADLSTISFNYIISLLLSKKVIAISKYVRNTLLNNIIIKYLFDNKVVVVHNFNKEFQIKKQFKLNKIDEVQFIFMGRLIRKKNIEEFLLIISNLILKIQIEYFSIQIYGDWHDENYKNEVILISKKLQLDSYLKLNSFSEKENIFKSNNLNFLFHTTKKAKPEPFGRVLLDAVFYGAIPITNGYGGAGEVIENNKNGIVYNINNLNPLIDLIQNYLNKHENYIVDLNRNYEMTKKKFSGQQQFEKLNSILSNL